MELSVLFHEDEMRNLSPSDWRHRMMLDTNPQTEEMRDCVKRLLDFAEKQGILDTEMLARLRNDDYDQFRSAIHELSVAEFLLPLGNINWRPRGRSSRVGEFEIAPVNYEPIFVEVKTIFESVEERRRGRNWNSLREVTHNILSPFCVNIEFLELPCDVIPRRFRPWFIQQIKILADEIKKIGQQRELIFEDSTNDDSTIRIKVAFTKMWDDDKPTLCSMSWSSWSSMSDNEKELYERVKEAIDGSLAQLPATTPNLVVVAPAIAFGIDEFQMLAAMFSFPKLTIYQGTTPTATKREPTAHYDLQGLVQQSIRTRLSAVGVWHHKWTKEPQGSLDVYHNPLRAKEISHRVLELPSVYQLIPSGVGTMEWIPNRPSE